MELAATVQLKDTQFSLEFYAQSSLISLLTNMKTNSGILLRQSINATKYSFHTCKIQTLYFKYFPKFGTDCPQNSSVS